MIYMNMYMYVHTQVHFRNYTMQRYNIFAQYNIQLFAHLPEQKKLA